MVAANIKHCKVYVFDYMPNYINETIIDGVPFMVVSVISLLCIAIRLYTRRSQFNYN